MKLLRSIIFIKAAEEAIGKARRVKQQVSETTAPDPTLARP